MQHAANKGSQVTRSKTWKAAAAADDDDANFTSCYVFSCK